MTAADNVHALIADHRRHERACRVHAARLRREAQQLRELPAGGARSLFRAHELARKAIALIEQADQDRAAAALLATTPALTRTRRHAQATPPRLPHCRRACAVA